MMKLKDLGYTKTRTIGAKYIIYDFSKLSVSEGEYRHIWIRDDGLYSSSDMITSEEHEAITGELFELGIYEMIGKHFNKHN